MYVRSLLQQWMRQNAEQTMRTLLDRGLKTRPFPPPDGAESEALPPVEIAVCCAMQLEAGGLLDLLGDLQSTRCPSLIEHFGSLDGVPIVVVETGVGRTAAARATRELIAMRRPRWIISSGFAGGLVDAVARQHLVLATSVIDESGMEISIPGSWGAASDGFHLGRLLTVDRVVRTAEEKRRLAEKWSACACDMESSAVLDTAREQGIGLLSVRVVTDDLLDELPPDIESILGKKSLASRLGAAAGAVLRRPASVKELWNLRERAIVASDRLARVLQGLIPALARHQES